MKKLLTILLATLLLVGCSEENGPKNITKEEARYTAEEVLTILHNAGYEYEDEAEFGRTSLSNYLDDYSPSARIYKDLIYPNTFTVLFSTTRTTIGERQVVDARVSANNFSYCRYDYDTNSYAFFDELDAENGDCDQLGIDKANEAVLEYDKWLTDLGLNYNDMLEFAKAGKLE